MCIWTEDLHKAEQELKEKGYSCVLCKGDSLLSSEKHGVAPLLGWKEEGSDLHGYSAADQVVGKAAALLYAGFGIAAIHCVVLSERGERILKVRGIPYTYEQKVNEIQNAAGTDMCPMEMAVLPTDDPEKAVGLLKAQIARLRAGEPPLRNEEVI